MKIYLIIPNVLLLSDLQIGKKVPNKKAKMVLGLGIPNYADLNAGKLPVELSDRRSLIDIPCKQAYVYRIADNHLCVASVDIAIDIEGVKTMKYILPALQKQQLVLSE